MSRENVTCDYNEDKLVNWKADTGQEHEFIELSWYIIHFIKNYIIHIL